MTKRRVPLDDYIPQPAGQGLPQSQPALGPLGYAENVSAGIGKGVRDQLAGLLRMAQNPKETVSALYGAATTPGQWAPMAAAALRETKDSAMSGPLGVGKVIGEMLPMGPRGPKAGPMRDMTAYHGSPHDFDKFELSDKTIGTGEGAQAYGHGLYFAEKPEVADTYRRVGGSDGKLYEVDIPDESIDRMLDWDKPLSQQSPAVNAPLREMADSLYGAGFYDEWLKANDGDYRDLWDNVLGESMDSSQISSELSKRGIPGIRYLDGGSRGDGTPTGGKGTRNFVVFDDKLVKVLKKE